MTDLEISSLRQGTPVYLADGRKFFFYCSMGPDYFGGRGYCRTNTENGYMQDFAVEELFLTPPKKEERKKTNMSDLLNKFVLNFKKEPDKSYIKAGIKDKDGVITEDGIKVFLTYLLDKNPDFKKDVVDDILKDIKEEKK